MNQINGANPIGIVGTGAINDSRSGKSLQDDFLKLLVAQMRFQDPLNPLDGADFTAQLAQFSSLEQLQNIGMKLDESVHADMLLARSINNTLAATLIGKSVRAVDNQVAFDGKHSTTINYDLSATAGSMTVEILNEDGVLIRTMTEANVDAGTGKIVWDGKDFSGNLAPEGAYFVEFNATAPGSGLSVQIQPLAIGRVDGVRFIDGNPVLLVEGRTIAFGNVIEILEGGNESGSESGSWINDLLREGN